MTFIIFFAFGAVVGWLVSQKGKGTNYGSITDTAIGAIGGLIGGWLFSEIGLVGVVGFLLSLLTAIVGAIVLIAIIRIVRPTMAAG